MTKKLPEMATCELCGKELKIREGHICDECLKDKNE